MSDDFRLSRVYAEGWNAANALTSNERDRLETWYVAACNPYADDPERSRWSEGFTKALGN